MGEILKSKDFVNLRQRRRPNGRITLYLDICNDGVRKYEYLKLYLVPENTKADKLANKETLKLAEAIKAQRVVEMQPTLLSLRQRQGHNGLCLLRHCLQPKENVLKDSETDQKRGNTPLFGLFMLISRILHLENRIFWKNPQKSVA